MKIIIPIGGVGQRFKDEDYDYPKPLINVLGKPMIIHLIENLDLSADDEIHIVFNASLNNYNFENIIKFKFPKKNIKFHCLEKQTRGASETVLMGLINMEEVELDSRFLILDCDTFYEENILSLYNDSDNGNVIFYFNDKEDKPIFSYLDIDDNNKVLSIEEKNKISQNASTGAYGFSNGRTLKKYCEIVSEQSGELYISNIYKKLIGDGILVSSIRVDKFNCVGTPLQLKIFSSNNCKNSEKLRFCFDLDNTLVSYPVISGDYSSVEPIWKNIEYLKFLKSCGHHIIIYTARRMKTHNGNLGAVISDIAKVTIESLEKFDIPYDELFFGKPYAHFYIDDLAVNAHSDLDKFIGVYDIHSTPRHFNEVTFVGDYVKKKTNNDGECFWYKNIPNNLKHFFPTVYEINGNDLKIEKINGVSFSYLFVNKLLTAENISTLINDIQTIHNSSEDSTELNIYENYCSKIEKRYYNNIELYSRYGLNDLFMKLMSLLYSYENNNKGKKGVIHGDSVFTNILLDENNNIKFIDMRGKVGDVLTIFGDINYDYAKIYQSLMGYDYILKSIEIDENYQNNIIRSFEEKFSIDEIKNIKIITSSLFFSLLPLHKDESFKFTNYIKIIKHLLSN